MTSPDNGKMFEILKVIILALTMNPSHFVWQMVTLNFI